MKAILVLTGWVLLLGALIFGFPSTLPPTPTNVSRAGASDAEPAPSVSVSDLGTLQTQIDILRRMVIALSERDVTPVNIEARTITFFHRGNDTLHIEVEEENRGQVQSSGRPAVAKPDHAGKAKATK